MNETTSFRLLVALAGASMLLALYVPQVAEPPPQQLQDLYGWLGYGAVIPGVVDERLWYVWLVLSIVGLLGAFFYWNFARPLLLLPLLISCVRAGLGGIYVSAPVEDAAWTLYYTFSTFVIGMAFFSEQTAQRFSRGRRAR